MPVKVRLRFFASLREAMGPHTEMDLPAGSRVADARDLLIARGAPFAQALARERLVRAAVNQVLCADEATLLADGDELAFFPPVTGG
jgi:molybdopterin synthase sulfur carrier subunit